MIFWMIRKTCIKYGMMVNGEYRKEFTTNVGWIVPDLIVILFGLKNLNIRFVKQSENKAAICLASFLFFNQVVIDSSGVCLDFPFFIKFFAFRRKKNCFVDNIQQLESER